MNALTKLSCVNAVSALKPLLVRNISVASKIFGVVFDIDGVLLKGQELIPKSDQAVQFLYSKQIPFCFMTNGGGRTEEDFALSLQSKLNVPIMGSQVIESHTHFKRLLPEYQNKKILGSHNYLNVALHYGYKKVITPQEYLALHPNNYPPKHYEVSKERYESISKEDKEPFHAIMVFHDPIDWSSEIQICMDVLQSTSTSTHHQNIPIYVGNPDLLYSGKCPQPRLACRAFLEALDGVYHANFNEHLKIQYYGKPYKVGYETCETIMKDLIQNTLYKDSQSKPALTQYYGIGDNPQSDILGANSAGPIWNSVFVKTGSLPAPKPNTNQYPKYIYENAFEAVHSIYDNFYKY